MRTKKQPILPVTSPPAHVSPGSVGHYRAGLLKELQKFGSPSRQLTFWREEGGEPIQVVGLKFTISQEKAVSAIQILLDKTGYQGNRPGTEVCSSTFKWAGTLPILAVTYPEYFEAYGLSRKADGRFGTHQVEKALEALESLTRDWSVYYVRKHWKGKGKYRREVSDIIKVTRPLIVLTKVKAWKDLEREEERKVYAGQEVPEKGRFVGMQIEVSPLWVDGIHDFYVLKPKDLHNEIQEQYGQKRPPRTISLFIQLLLTKNKKIYRISWDNLIGKLWLNSYVERRHKKEAIALIREAIQVSIKLGYLTSYEEEITGNLLFVLNTEKCKRISSREPGER